MPLLFIRSTIPDLKQLEQIRDLLESIKDYQDSLKELAEEQLEAIKEITDK